LQEAIKALKTYSELRPANLFGYVEMGFVLVFLPSYREVYGIKHLAGMGAWRDHDTAVHLCG